MIQSLARRRILIELKDLSMLNASVENQIKNSKLLQTVYNKHKKL